MEKKMKFLFWLFVIFLISASFASAYTFQKFFENNFGTSSQTGRGSSSNLLSPGGTAIRTLPSTYASGSIVNVVISFTLDSAICSSVVTETPPAGWTITNISGLGGGTLGADGKIRWTNDGPGCGGGFSFILSYNATSPIGETGTKTFSGDLDVIDTNLNIFSFVIGGATLIFNGCVSQEELENHIQEYYLGTWNINQVSGAIAQYLNGC